MVCCRKALDVHISRMHPTLAEDIADSSAPQPPATPSQQPLAEHGYSGPAAADGAATGAGAADTSAYEPPLLPPSARNAPALDYNGPEPKRPKYRCVCQLLRPQRPVCRSSYT